MGLGLERIPEEHQEVDLPVGDQRAELLVTAKGPTLQLEDPDAERLLEERPRCAGADQLVRHEQALVVDRPLDEVRLLVVVRDKADLLPLVDRLFHRLTFLFGGDGPILLQMGPAKGTRGICSRSCPEAAQRSQGTLQKFNLRSPV